jgi:DNA-directed RNA polymerase specialized sigma24 family protein
MSETVARDGAESKVAATDAWATIVRAAGEKLSPRQLGAFLLARGQGFSYEEIARVHGCSTATVKRDLRDALETLSSAAAKLGLVSS